MKTTHQLLLATTCFLLCAQALFAQSSSGTKPEMLMNRYNSQNVPPARTTVNEGDTLGWIRWRGYSTGPAYISSAEIRAYVSGTPTATYIPSNLVFKTGPSMADRMNILDNGNIGVGTSAPLFLFDVNGDARVSQRFRLGANGKTALFDFNDTLVINSQNGFSNDVLVDSDLRVRGALIVDDLEVLNDLKVGRDAIIGRDLSVGRNGSVAEDMTVGKNLSVAQNTNVQGQLNVQQDAGFNANVSVTSNVTVGNDLSVAQDARVGDDLFVTGRVAIGAGGFSYISNTEDFELMVDGGIICEEARVALSGVWPDYVFGSTYNLKPIGELEQYIQTHQHLPNIPSAQEMTAQGGIDLGDMNIKLLEKVEELTLYLIQQQKEIDALKNQLNQLQK